MKMNAKILSIVSAVFLLAACENPGANNGGLDANGNPINGSGSENVVPGSQADLEKNVGDRVFFALDSSVLTSEAQGVLQRQAKWLQQYGQNRLSIEGHADERGTREYNIALGERRAAAVKKYLSSLGIDSKRLSTISYGKEPPAVIGSNEEAWAQNRRAVSVVAQ